MNSDWKYLEQQTSEYKTLNPIALRKAKIVYNFGLSECNRVKRHFGERERERERVPGKLDWLQVVPE